MAKKKRKFTGISKFLLGELVVLIFLLLLLLPYSTSNTPGVSTRGLPGLHTGSEDKQGNTPGVYAGGSAGVHTGSGIGKQLRVPILMYHYIGGNPNPEDIARDNLSVSPEKFDEQMGYLAKAGYTPITLDTMVAGLYKQITLPQKPLILTFDDGYVDFFYNAYPILSKYNFKSVLFVPTGLVGREAYLNWEQLGKLQSSGLVSIQAHSVNHAHLVSLDETAIIYELQTSKRTLEEKYEVPVNFVAYPYGASNQAVWNVAKRVGYIGGLGTWNASIQSEGTLFDMPRIKIAGEWNIETFASVI